jgi:polyribonucleotide nucleotidyltransferase
MIQQEKKLIKELMVFFTTMMRNDILKDGKRIAGRGLTEVREIETETSVLKKLMVHLIH